MRQEQLPEEPCPEPPGNDLLFIALNCGFVTAHEMMIQMSGQCPWCGGEK